MSNEVMVALDGSKKEGRALSVARALARLSDATLHLVRVVKPPPARVSMQAELVGVTPDDAVGRYEAEEQIASTARRLTADNRHPVTWEVLVALDVARALIRVAQARHAQLIVLGTRAASRVGLALAGSVADRVMRASPRPVVLVPPGAADLKGKAVTIRDVLVPLDGSALAARSAEFLLALPQSKDLRFVFVEVVHNRDDVAYVAQRLKTVVSRFRARSMKAKSHVIVAGDAGKALATAARELTVDMIAMSTRGESGLKRFVLGSVAKAVVHAAECPVLLLTPAMLAGKRTRKVAATGFSRPARRRRRRVVTVR